MQTTLVTMSESESESSLEDEKEKQQDGLKSSHVKTVALNRDGSEPCDVYSWFEITIQNIDIPSQSWQASVEVHVFWQDYEFAHTFPKYDTQDFVLSEESVPIKLSEVFENRLEQGFENPPTYKFYPNSSTIYMMFTSNVTFVERMELHRFPIDRQFLNMEFNGWVKDGNWNWIVFDQDKVNPSKEDIETGTVDSTYLNWVPKPFRKPFAVRMVSSITEYELLSPWIDFACEQPLLIRLRVERQPTFYFGNIVLPNFLIVLGCFAAFPIPASDVADRLSVTVNLMLAAVAFRFVVETMLPKVSYLTLMDYYLLIGFISLTLLILENAVAGFDLIHHETRAIIDWTCAIVFGLMWIIIHVFALIMLLNGNFLRKTWDVMDKEDQQEEEEFKYPEKDAHILYPKPKSSDWDVYKKLGGPEDRANYYRKSHAGPEQDGPKDQTTKKND